MRNILKWYHEIIAISVTLSAWTGGTATYTNLPWESYTLASLPIWTEIVLDNWDYLIYYDGLPRWEIEVTPSSGYNIDSMVVDRWWVQTTVSSTPIVLEEWDKISATFEISILCFTANTAWSTIQLTQTGTPTEVTLETSTDWNTWSTYTIWDTITLTDVWDKVYWRNTSTTDTKFSTSSSNYYQFVMTWSIAGSKDITKLLNKNWTNKLSRYCFYNLFSDCTSLTTAPTLPVTSLSPYCYYNMFKWCSNLTVAPALPATRLIDYCYFYMFRDCTSLTVAPTFNATYVWQWCCCSMFRWCTSLTTAPITISASYNACCNGMFTWCTSLTTPPILSATTLDRSCYSEMFNWCTSLETIPALPATTLADGCYSMMFYKCSKIKISETQTWEYVNEFRVPTTWTWTGWNNPTNNMFYNTWWTFTGTPDINTTYYTSNTVVS